MRVSLINKTEVQLAIAVWMKSRPKAEITAGSLKEILSLDLPVCEFIPMVLEIESTIYEREVIATMRNHVMWAQTSRVQDCLAFEIDYDVNSYLSKHKDIFEDYREQMKTLKGAGARQDEYRLLLPMMSKTKYCVAMNYRSVMKLALYFEAEFKKGHYLSEQFRKFAQQLFAVIDYMLYFFDLTVGDVRANFKPYKILNEEPLYRDRSSSHEGIIVNTGTLPYHLRAQLVRHRGINILDDLHMRFHSLSAGTATLSSEVRVTVYGTYENFAEVLSKRSCWIAHYKIWKGFLAGIEKYMVGEQFLPCAGGVCPFDGDAHARFIGADPNPPCPIHCKLYNLDPSHEQVKEMFTMVQADKRDLSFWSAKISEITLEKQQ